MSSYMAKNVKCPYYGKEDDVKIHCDGVEEGTFIHLVFASPSMRRNYQLDVCCDDYESCPIAEAHRRKWEEDI